MTDARPLHYGLLAMLSVMWGLSFLFIKLAVATLPPLSMAAGRIAIGALVLGLLVAVRRRRLPRDARVWWQLFWIGILGNSLPFYFIGWGEERISSALASVIMATVPLTALVLAHVFTRDDRLAWNKAMGVAIGFAGMIVLVGLEALQEIGQALWAQLSVLLGASLYPMATLVARKLPPIDFTVAGFGALLMATVTTLPVALWVDVPWTLDISLLSGLSVLWLGILPTGLASIFYFWVVRDVGVTFVSNANYVIPLVGVFAGSLVLQEALSPRAWTALGLVLLGIATTQWRRDPS